MMNTMTSRADLHEQLLKIAPHVYFQPPSKGMDYPCIMYDLANISKKSANNARYITNRSYKLTVIDKDPESEICEKLLDFPSCVFQNRYKTQGLYHSIFIIYI